jgi:hypothetical protein
LVSTAYDLYKDEKFLELGEMVADIAWILENTHNNVNLLKGSKGLFVHGLIVDGWKQREIEPLI